MKIFPVLTVFGIALSSSSAMADESSNSLELSGDFTLQAFINEHPVLLRVEPEFATALRILNGEKADEIGLKPTMWKIKEYVGPVRLKGELRKTLFRVADSEKEGRFAWYDRTLTARADGIVTPGALPYRTVIFHLRPPILDERAIVFDMSPVRDSGWGFDGGQAYADYGDVRIQIGFNFDRPQTLATASTGRVLLDMLGGKVSPEGQDILIRAGISRPVHDLSLERPLSLNGLSITNLAVRTADNGILTPGFQSETKDPDEIIVRAGKKEKHVKYDMIVGADDLAACSTLSYDFVQRKVTLSCAAAS